MTVPPLPFAQCPAAALAAVHGVFTDIDDTLTRHGAIEPQALAALGALHAAGLPVIALTGRPFGWSEPFARVWPLAALVAENGAVALLRQGSGLDVEFAQDAPTRAANARRLQATAARVLAAVPAARLATDSPGRLTDIAIDHAEHATLGGDDIARVVALMHADGLQATVSSIHINGWFGPHSKASAARWMVQRLFGRDLQGEIDRWIFVGDSTNDEAMFEAFPLAVGVANLRRFAPQLRHWPAWITEGERGTGFAEVASRLLGALQEVRGGRQRTVLPPPDNPVLPPDAACC